MEELKTDSQIRKRNPVSLLRRRSQLLLFTAILLGILVNILFYGHFPLGVSYPIFILTFYSVFLLHLRKQVQIRLDFGWLLMIPILMLSFTYLFFSNPVFFVLDFLAIPALVIMQTLLISGRAKEDWHSATFVVDWFYGILYRPLAYIAVPFQAAGHLVRSRLAIKENSPIVKVLLGVVITIPLLILIVLLLSSADEVFSRLVGKLPDLLLDVNFYNFLPRLIFGIVTAVLAYSYIWSLMRPKWAAYPGVTVTAQRTSALRIDQVIAATFLTIINSVYVLFTVIQFSYLFGSSSGSLPGSFTYSEYARRGFFELVFVTMINFGILLFLLYRLKKGSRAVSREIQCLESLLVICTSVMLVSAFIRMYLYEQMFGYTYLRVLTHAFMIFLFVLFLITFVRIWRSKVKLYPLYLVTAICAFVVINYINVDVLITKGNMDRYEKTDKIDLNYLAELSDDAIPEMTRLLQAKDEAVAGKVENILFERYQTLKQPQSWQSFNLSRERAKKELAKYDLHYDDRYDSQYRD